MTPELERETVDLEGPDLEDLAAYIDGRLTGARKTQVEERLFRDDEYHEIFLDAVRFQQAQAQGAGEVVRPPAGRWGRSWRVAATVAAAAAAAVLGVVLLSPDRTVAGWASRLAPQAVLAQGERWDDPGWSRSRGGEEAYRPKELAFRLGVRSLQLRLALSAGEREIVALQADRLARLAREAELVLVPALYESLKDDDVEIGELRRRAELAEKACYEDDSPEQRFYLLGAWAEAGRLAALTHDGKALSRLARARPAVPPEAGLDSLLANLDAALDRKGADRFQESLSAFSGILSALAGS